MFKLDGDEPFSEMDATFSRFWVGDFQLCPRNLTLLGSFGVFMGLLMPLRVSMTVYLSHLELFCPRLSLKGTLFIPIVSNQMIKIRREIISETLNCKMCEIDNFVVSENYDIRIWTGSGPSPLGQTVHGSL